MSTSVLKKKNKKTKPRGLTSMTGADTDTDRN